MFVVLKLCVKEIDRYSWEGAAYGKVLRRESVDTDTIGISF